MEKILKKLGDDVFSENFVTTNDTDFKLPSIVCIISSFVLSVAFFSGSLIIHYHYVFPLVSTSNYDIYHLFWLKLTLSILTYFSVYMFMNVVILSLIRILFRRNFKITVFPLVLYKKNSVIKICSSFFITCYLLNFYEYVVIPAEIIENTPGLLNEENLSRSRYFIDNFSKINMSVACLFATFLFKSLLMCITELKIFFSHYKTRIDVNRKNTELIEILNCHAGNQTFTNLTKWAKHVFNIISHNNIQLSFQECQKVFGLEITEKLFVLFDTNNDLTVTSEEFVSVYHGVVREKYWLNKSLLQKSKLFDKLDIIVTVIFLPIGLFTSLSFLGLSSYFSNIISVASGVILSLSFVFSSVVGDMFRSLIFIFFVRPFEAGDHIKLLDKLYIVEELGLLYTSFFVDGLLTYIPNSELMKEKIKNYRISELEEVKYKFKFNSKVFRSKQEDLCTRINQIVKADTKIYLGKYYVTNFELLSEYYISVDVIIYFRVNFQYIKGLSKNKDNFLLELEKVFCDLQLNVY